MLAQDSGGKFSCPPGNFSDAQGKAGHISTLSGKGQGRFATGTLIKRDSY